MLKTVRLFAFSILCLSLMATSMVGPGGHASLNVTTHTAHIVDVAGGDHGLVPPELQMRAALYAKLHSLPGASFDLGLGVNVTTRKLFHSDADSRSSHVLIYDAKGDDYLPGTRARFENGDKVKDKTVNNAFDFHSAMRSFLKKEFGRNSFDDKGADLVGSVHYGDHYNNAFWNGRQMVYGDGDQQFFASFVLIDVVGHEMFHAVTDNTSMLIYEGQSGAINEHLSDVFGVLLRQWNSNLNVDKDSWLVGPGLFTYRMNGRALRDMRFPGTAYNDPIMGKDRQPAHIKDVVEISEDYGGVHRYSGIPNKAFALFAIAVGGKAWKTAGHVWYDVASSGNIPPDCDFQTFANATLAACIKLAPSEVGKLKDAWAAVGITVA